MQARQSVCNQVLPLTSLPLPLQVIRFLTQLLIIQMRRVSPGKSYIFTPNVPTAPSGLNFTAVGPTSQTLNWTDNSGNELGFAIYRSTDGVNYSFIGQTAANATSYTDTGLTQSTNYSYQVYAVTEGALSSPPLSGNQATAAGGNDTCNGVGGLWSATGT